MGKIMILASSTIVSCKNILKVIVVINFGSRNGQTALYVIKIRYTYKQQYIIYEYCLYSFALIWNLFHNQMHSVMLAISKIICISQPSKNILIIPLSAQNHPEITHNLLCVPCTFSGCAAFFLYINGWKYDQLPNS